MHAETIIAVILKKKKKQRHLDKHFGNRFIVTGGLFLNRGLGEKQKDKQKQQNRESETRIKTKGQDRKIIGREETMMMLRRDKYDEDGNWPKKEVIESDLE